jgi:hypothetical protein
MAFVKGYLDIVQTPVDPGFGVPTPPEVNVPVFPTHPIVLPPENPGEPPPVISGGPGSLPPFVMPPIAFPPIIWPQPPEGGPPIAIDPGHPEHPIVLPTPPNVVWPPDASAEHPIVLPLPPEIWPSPGSPAHPIVIPPPPEPGRTPLFTWYSGWSDKHGWVVVAVPNFPHPSPAKKRP